MSEKSNKKETKLDIDHADAAFQNDVVLVLLKKFLDQSNNEAKWKSRKRMLFLFIFIIFMGFFWLVKLSEMGYEVMPKNETVAILPVEGVIAKGQPASADAIIPILTKLFNNKNIKAIVLDIQSGGGSPTESERIYKTIERLKKEHNKPFVTVCSNICASAAYMLAIRGDEVYAGKYTLVGSIGAIMQSWDFSESIKIADAGYRVFASGEYKDLINPYKELEDYKGERLQGIVNEMGRIFKNDVIEKRKGKLAVKDELFTGNVWTADIAESHGLIDEIKTLEEVLNEKWPETKSIRFMPRPKKSDFLDRVFGYVDNKIESYVTGKENGNPVKFEF